MNKYQEALNYLRYSASESEYMKGVEEQNNISYDLLQELVDMREEVLKLCLIVIDSSWKSETYELPNGKCGDTGYSIDLAELIYETLNGSKDE